jgi:hypothetical protein
MQRREDAVEEKRGLFKSRMTFEKATLNLRTFRSASCGTQEARETAKELRRGRREEKVEKADEK